MDSHQKWLRRWWRRWRKDALNYVCECEAKIEKLRKRLSKAETEKKKKLLKAKIADKRAYIANAKRLDKQHVGFLKAQGVIVNTVW
jgi:hypothetical protein